MTSNAIVFVSMFLGIVTGPQTIEVAVSEDVAAVELLVDGQTVAEIFEQPWRISYDFGPELTTRQLTAVALDPTGHEISRTEQFLNVPRARVETEILLEDWIDGRPLAARLIWHSAEALQPLRIAVSVDGQQLDSANPRRIELPPLDPDALHFLVAEIVFPDREMASTEVVFGGAYGSAVETEITAVPLYVGWGRARSIEVAQGWLQADGSALEVVAIDESPAEVAFVREDAAARPLADLDVRMRRARDFNYKGLRLDKRDRMRFSSTRPSNTEHPAVRYEVFPISKPYAPQDGSIPGLLAGVYFKGDSTQPEQFTDALAVAGRFLVESQKRRSVVAVTANCAGVSGKYAVAAVRGYLEELHVPLRVWQIGRVPPEVRKQGLCDVAEEIYTPKKYAAAVRRLQTDLDRQQIVWVRGRPLPRDIALTPLARGVELVGR